MIVIDCDHVFSVTVINGSKCFVCIILFSPPINHVRKDYSCSHFPGRKWRYRASKNCLKVIQLVKPRLGAHAFNNQAVRKLSLCYENTICSHIPYHGFDVYFQIILWRRGSGTYFYVLWKNERLSCSKKLIWRIYYNYYFFLIASLCHFFISTSPCIPV